MSEKIEEFKRPSLLLALIPLQGIFYYSFHRVDVGYYVIGTIILSMCFKYTLKRS